MDGRGVSLFALAFVLMAAPCGCVPKQFTIPADPKQALDERPEPSEPINLNPFASKPKREPKVELDIATFFEKKALKELRNNPEQQQRHFDLARKAYQEILVYDNKYLPAYRGLGRVYVAQRDFARAEATYRKALEFHPKDVELYQGLAAVYGKKGDYAGAIQVLTKALEIDPENHESMQRLGIMTMQSGQIDRGAAIITRAIGQAAGHLIAAQTLALTNHPDEARHHAQLAVQANPNSADARAFLADLDRGRAPQNPNANSNPIVNVGLQFDAEQ